MHSIFRNPDTNKIVGGNVDIVIYSGAIKDDAEAKIGRLRHWQKN